MLCVGINSAVYRGKRWYTRIMLLNIYYGRASARQDGAAAAGDFRDVTPDGRVCCRQKLIGGEHQRRRHRGVFKRNYTLNN